MLLANFVEYFTRRPGTALRYIVKTLPDGFLNIHAGHYVKQPLVRFGVLQDRFRLSPDSEHYRAFVLLELLHELGGNAPERGDGMDVFRDIEHGNSSL